MKTLYAFLMFVGIAFVLASATAQAQTSVTEISTNQYVAVSEYSGNSLICTVSVLTTGQTYYACTQVISGVPSIPTNGVGVIAANATTSVKASFGYNGAIYGLFELSPNAPGAPGNPCITASGDFGSTTVVCPTFP